MENKNWYLVYTPDITKGIFDKLVIHLNSTFGDFKAHCGISLNYESFKDKKFIRSERHCIDPQLSFLMYLLYCNL